MSAPSRRLWILLAVPLLVAWRQAEEVQFSLPRRPAACAEDVRGLVAVLIPGDNPRMTYCAGLPRQPSPDELSPGEPCSPEAEQWLYAPSQWGSPEPLHFKLRYDTSRYFYDSLFGGADSYHDTSGKAMGIETGLLAFYAGHGGPWGWSAGTGTAWLDRVLLGNDDLEYLLMCSCNILAHGPACPDGLQETCHFHYQNPQKYLAGREFSPDEPDRRDVFFRWRSRLVKGMRLLCGGVSKSCHLSTAPALMWDRYLNHCASPADAFIGGIGNETEVMGCLAVGPKKPEETALYYAAFGLPPAGTSLLPEVEIPTADPGEYLHFQYGVFRSLSLSRSLLESLDYSTESQQLQLPVFRLAEPRADSESSHDCERTFPAAICEAISETVNLDPPFVWGEGPDWSVWSHGVSGSVHFRRALPAPEETSAMVKGSELVHRAKEHIMNLGLDVPIQKVEEIEPSSVTRMLIDRVPRWSVEQPTRFVKSSVVEFRRVILPCPSNGPESVQCQHLHERGLDRIPVLGEGGKILVELGPEMELVSAARVWRPVVPGATPDFKPVISLDAAENLGFDRLARELSGDLEEEPSPAARGRVRNLFRLHEESSEFGYVERSASCLQRDLWPAYRLRFVPVHSSEGTGESGSQSRSPRLIEIPAITGFTEETACTRWDVEAGRIVARPEG